NGKVDIHQELNGLSGPKSRIALGNRIGIYRCTPTEFILWSIANADIQIKTETGTILSQGKISSDSRYTLDITNVRQGTILTSMVKSGNLEYHFSYTLPPIPPKFIVTETTEYDIKGIGKPTATVGLQDGVFRHGVDADGSFRVRLSNHVPIGTKLYLNQAYDERESPSQEVLVGWTQKVNPVTAASTKLTGTGSPNTPTHVQTENGQVIGRGQADKDGNYTITIPIQADGTKLRVFQTIAGTEYMTPITVEKNPYTLTVSPYQIGTSNVAGSYDGTDLDQITKVVLFVDGVIVKNGAFNNTTKTFQISANGFVTNANQRVEVALFHGNTELKRARVTVTERPSASYTVTPATYQLGTSNVTGTYTGTDVSQITKVVLLVDGVVVKNGAFNNTTKAFQIAAGVLVNNSKQRVEVALFNGTKELKRATVFVTDAYTLTMTTYQIGNANVTGSYSGLNTGAITKAVLLVDGVVVKNGALNTNDNTFRIATNGFVTNMRQRVEVALFIGTIEVKRMPVNVLGHFTLTPAAYQLGTN
ncbi:Ig-like domain-containing protein, partial [Listeria booriae]|uniref:immunoglobulin-like domain-containing protein n=1 Tax=Listeria booriae TaxID=1552123 RepID=UPI002880804F